MAINVFSPCYLGGWSAVEHWVKNSKDKYFSLQAKEGDSCMFLKDQGVEIKFENKKISYRIY
jgi:hypothetical protein